MKSQRRLFFVIIFAAFCLFLRADVRDTYHQPDKVMDVVGVKPGMVIGEVGAGHGYFTFHLSRRVDDSGKIYANDIATRALASIRRKCEGEGITNIETIVGEVEDPLFPDDELDMVFIVNAFHDLAKPVELLNNIVPSLKPGAPVVIIDRDPDKVGGYNRHVLTQEEVLEHIKNSDFDLDRIETFLPQHNIYIINTHSHGDHAGGNKSCGGNAVVIGYDDLGQMVSEGVLSRGDESNNYYSMNFNGEEIMIIPSPGAHSDKDLIIYFTESGVVHMGDLLLTQSFPAVGPKVKKYLEILDWVIDEFPQDIKFIGGHGRDYSLAEVKDYRKMLVDTIKIVQKGMKAGKSMEDMKKEDVLNDYKSWGVFLEFLDTDSWIASIYNSYKND